MPNTFSFRKFCNVQSMFFANVEIQSLFFLLTEHSRAHQWAVSNTPEHGCERCELPFRTIELLRKHMRPGSSHRSHTPWGCLKLFYTKAPAVQRTGFVNPLPDVLGSEPMSSALSSSVNDTRAHPGLSEATV